MQDTWPTAAGLELESQPLADPSLWVPVTSSVKEWRDQIISWVPSSPSNSRFCIHGGKRKDVSAIIPLNLSREEPSSIIQAHTRWPPTTLPSCQISSPQLPQQRVDKARPSVLLPMVGENLSMGPRTSQSRKAKLGYL